MTPPAPTARATNTASPAHTALLIVNLGTPDEPKAPAVRRYLRQFLGDRRVVEIPPLLWLPILHGIILRTRPARSAAKYASVWTPEGSPLAVWTRRQAALLAEELGRQGQRPIVEHAMRYGRPSIAGVLDGLVARGAARILVLPMYPQYCGATTATVNDEVMRWALTQRAQPELRFVGAHHDDPGYIDALAARVQAHWQAHGRGDKLLLSFHGMPARTREFGDPYHGQCLATAARLRHKLALPDDRLVVTFQSRFGRARWLEPYTEPTLVEMARQGLASVDVMCPGFAADCLETLEEIDQEARAAFLRAGGKTFNYIPCLNDSPPWIAALAALATRHLQGWPPQAQA